LTEAWVTIGGLAVTTAAIKAAGPVLLGGRELPAIVRRTIRLLAPALLAALVVVQTFGGDGRTLALDARAAGLAAAALALAARLPLLVTVSGAAGATALVRAIG
jgi:branched chain amino acid efflux pump